MTRIPIVRAGAGVAATLVAMIAAASPAAATPRFGPVLWASPRGTASMCSRSVPCGLSEAVAQARPGATVVALPGVYHDGVVIDRRIKLRGEDATLDATSAPSGNGVQIVGPGGSGSEVEGFKIERARFEGILVGTAPVAPSSTDGAPATSGEAVHDVTIADNVLIDNGTGFGTDLGQCFSTPEAPGDCGETIHLVSTTDSIVEHNEVTDNVGGILLTDEFGPTAGDVVRDNYVALNSRDCGITLAGHSSAAVDPSTMRPTGAAGVFDNLVEDNTSDENGVSGQGAGILLGGGAPDAGVYDNVVRGNVAAGNGLAGVAVHQHLAGDLNDNRIEGNEVSNDNLDGDDDFSPADQSTTGILVASGPLPGLSLPAAGEPSPIRGTVVRGNRIGGVTVGIWTLGTDPASTEIAGNVFAPGTVTPVSVN